MARRLFATALLIALLPLPGVALAHAELASSVPAAGSTVGEAPRQVTAVFENHGELAAAGSLLRVTDAAGATVDQGDSALDRGDAERKTLVVSLRPDLPDGVYTVAWTAVSSEDGSVEEGEFTFTVRSAAAATGAPATGGGAPATSGDAATTAGAPGTTLPATGAGAWPPWATLLPGAALMVAAGLALRRRAAR